jgi:hypothetical protein
LSINELPIYDEDTISLAVITFPSRDAEGIYQVRVNLKEYQTNDTIASQLMTWNLIPNSQLYSTDVPIDGVSDLIYFN